MEFPRLWLNDMMNVFNASRNFAALSWLDGMRTGNFFPAKQIFPFGKIRAISFPWLLLPFLLYPDRRIWVKIPESLKYRVKLYLGIYNRVTNFLFFLHVPFKLRHIRITLWTNWKEMVKRGQKSTRQVVSEWLRSQGHLTSRGHNKKGQKAKYYFTHKHLQMQSEDIGGCSAQLLYSFGDNNETFVCTLSNQAYGN